MYKLVCKDIEVKEIYVGSTVNINERRRTHKCSCNKASSKGYNLYVYQYIRRNGGFENFEIIVIETIEYNEKHELKARERVHMEELKATLNKQVPNRTRDEYVQQNKEHINVQRKQYRQENKAEIQEQNHQYYQNNKDQILQKQEQYNQDNKEHIRQYKNQYYQVRKEVIAIKQAEYQQTNKEAIHEYQCQYRQNNKEHILQHKNEKHDCGCGGKYTTSNKLRHEKTKRHQEHINN